MDQRYADLIVRRWQEYTGKQAVLDGDECSFEEISLRRGSPTRRSKRCLRQSGTCALGVAPYAGLRRS
jgi:hypothetical protein